MTPPVPVPHSEKQKSLNVSGIILPPHVIVGQKGRVSLSIEGRRVDQVQTAWFLNDTLISDTSLTGRLPHILLCLKASLCAAMYCAICSCDTFKAIFRDGNWLFGK